MTTSAQERDLTNKAKIQAHQRRRGLWEHDCPNERLPVATALGEPCNWCGAKEESK